MMIIMNCFGEVVQLLSANPQKWSNKQNNSQQFADELFKCV